MRASDVALVAVTLLLTVAVACGESEAGNDDPGGAGQATAGAASGGSAGKAGNASSGSASGGSSSAGDAATGGASGGAVGGRPIGEAGADNSAAGASGLVDCDARKIMCRRAAPVCDAGEVPSIEGICYGPCVKIDSCACSAAEDCPDPNQYTCWAQQHCGPYVQ